MAQAHRVTRNDPGRTNACCSHLSRTTAKVFDQGQESLDKLYASVLELLSSYNFRPQSAFAERYGCWEARFQRVEVEGTAFISLACPLWLETPVSLEISAGVQAAAGSDSPPAWQRVFLGSVDVTSFDPLPPGMIETLHQAVDSIPGLTRELSSTISDVGPSSHAEA